MTRILLVNPDWGSLFSGRVRRFNRRFPPLDLLNCAALLRGKGAEVSIVDLRANPEHREKISDNYDMYLVTLSPLDRWQCPNTDLDHVDTFLRGFPREQLFLMGAQPTLRPEIILKRTGAAGVILGEPEHTVCALANGAKAGDAPGTAAMVEGQFRTGGPTQDVAIEELPIPAFDLIDFNHYQYEVLGGQFGLLELTRGCPWSCGYCLLTMYPKKYRRKSIAQMLEEIRVAWSYGMRTAYFQDLEFTLDHSLVTELCDALLTEGIPLKWACQTRADTVNRSLLTLMKRAGCELIHYGVESGVQRIVDSTDKKQSLDEVEEGVKIARELGMRTVCFFLLGLPGESRSDMQQTLAFAQKIQPTYASFKVATPYPTTPFFEAGQFDEAFPDVFPGPLDGDELRALARRFTYKYHMSARYLRRRFADLATGGGIREIGLLLNYIKG